MTCTLRPSSRLDVEITLPRHPPAHSSRCPCPTHCYAPRLPTHVRDVFRFDPWSPSSMCKAGDWLSCTLVRTRFKPLRTSAISHPSPSWSWDQIASRCALLYMAGLWSGCRVFFLFFRLLPAPGPAPGQAPVHHIKQHRCAGDTEPGDLEQIRSVVARTQPDISNTGPCSPHMPPPAQCSGASRAYCP